LVKGGGWLALATDVERLNQAGLFELSTDPVKLLSLKAIIYR
jgi:hypothetical protein